MGVKVTFVSLLAIGLFLVPCLSQPTTERTGIDDKDQVHVLTTDKTATTAAAATDVPQNSDVPADDRKVTTPTPKSSDEPDSDKTTDVPTSPKTTPATTTTPTPTPTPLTTPSSSTNSTSTPTTPAPTTNTTATPEPTSSTASTSPAAPITTPTPAPSGGGNQFNGWSFFGGILLTLLLAAIGFVGFKYYKLRSGTGGRYNTF